MALTNLTTETITGTEERKINYFSRY